MRTIKLTILTILTALLMAASAYAAPTAPRNLTATNTSAGTVVLDWEPPTSGTPSYYRIYKRYADGTWPGINNQTYSTSGTVTNRTVTGLANGEHAWVVRAETSKTKGPESNIAMITLGPVPTPTPTPTPTATPTATPTPPPTSTLWAWDAANATVDPNSAALISAFQTYAVVNPNLATNQWAVAPATAGSGDPTYSIPRTDQGGSITVRIKLGTKPDPAGDGHLTVRDAEAGVETDFWQAVYNSTTQRISSTSAAVSFPIDSVNERTAGWGGNAANTPLERGLVTPEQIVAGNIGKTMQFGMPKIGGTTSTFRWPALHNAPTCGTSCTNHLVEGTWVRLDPTYDVTASLLPLWQKTLAHALQDHGMILRDNSGSLAIYGKNPINGGMAWSATGIGSGGSQPIQGFPWNRLQVLTPPGP